MSAEPVRYGAAKLGEPVEHELPPFVYKGEQVEICVVVRRLEDGSWRGYIVFDGPPDGNGVTTADIFYAENEDDFWLSVRSLREHHLRDLYRAVSE